MLAALYRVLLVMATPFGERTILVLSLDGRGNLGPNAAGGKAEASLRSRANARSVAWL